MKRVLLTLVVVSLILLVALATWIHFVLPGFVKNYIEQDLAQSLGAQISVAEVDVTWVPPIGLALHQIRFQKSFLNTSIVRIDFRIPFFRSLGLLTQNKLAASLYMLRPEIDFILKEEKKTPPSTHSTQSTSKSSLNIPIDFDFRMFLDEGRLEVKSESLNTQKQLVTQTVLKLEKIKSTLQIPSLQETWDLSFVSVASLSKELNLNLPIELKTKINTDLSKSQLSLQTEKLSIAGIQGQVSAVHNWGTSSSQFQAQVSPTDLSKIPNLSLPGQWNGEIQAKLQGHHTKDLQVSGAFSLKNLNAMIQHQQEGFKLDGRATGEIFADFKYNQSFQLTRLLSNLNLDQLAIEYKNLFQKQKSTIMRVRTDISQNQGMLQISEASLDLAQVKLRASGQASMTPGKRSQIKITVPPSQLSGLERIFAMLSTAPPQGSVQLTAQVTGDLQKPENLSVNINPLSLKQASANIIWRSQDQSLTLSGPAKANLNGRVNIEGKSLKSSQLNGEVDLTGMSIVQKTILNKPKGSLLKAFLSAQQSGESLSFKNTRLVTSSGELNISGNIKEPLKPQINLKLSTKRINLSELAKWIEKLKSSGISGVLKGDVNLLGSWDPKLGIERTPLTINGSLDLNIPKMTYIPEPTVVGESSQNGKPSAKSEPLLPNWQVLKNSSIRNTASIKEFLYKDLRLQGVSWKGLYSKGGLTGNLDISSVFGGKLKVQNVATNLLSPTPSTKFELSLSALQAGQAMDWAMPTWKGLVKGSTTGKIAIQMPHQSHPQFLELVKSQGQLRIQNGFLSTLQFDKMIKEKLAKIPGIGGRVQNLNTKGVTANILSQFNLANGLLQLSKFNALTPEKNELDLKGTIKMDKTLNLAGTAFISNPPIQGSVLAANSDNQGRLMVPVKIQGNAFSPDLNIADETIKTMISRTATQEGKKLKSKAEEKLKEELNKQKDKILKDIFNQ